MDPSPRIAVIGAGFGGLAVTIELKRAGLDDIKVFEKADTVGGVWRENTYPGAACDVPSPYYSFSFAPNPAWSRRFAPQPDILDYLERVTDEYDVRRHLRLGTEVTTAAWNEQERTWRIETADGEVHTADVLVPAVGQLSRPSLPAIAGRDRFAGPSFHSAQWDHRVDLTGKRVAVIGTGASAVQLVPEIAGRVGRLSLFQRTPPHVVPRMDRPFGERHHRMFRRFPVTQSAERLAWFGVTELLGVSLLHVRSLARVVTGLSHWHMRRQLADPELLAKVWPAYPIGCKRILFSNDYLPALRRPNVEVVTTAIEEITAGGVRTVDGVEHPADVLVHATGFTATDFLAPLRITGVGGRDLRKQWAAEGARAYLGIAVPHFPNLFLVYGPNTNLGSGSIVYMLESQARYIRRAVLAARGRRLVVRPEVEASYDERIQGRLAGGVWSGCQSWYRDARGRISTNWPLLPLQYRIATTRFRAGDYDTV